MTFPNGTRLALCAQDFVDPDWWFAPPGEERATARMYCAICLAASDCLRLALALHPVEGMWAGTTVRERDVVAGTAGSGESRPSEGPLTEVGPLLRTG